MLWFKWEGRRTMPHLTHARSKQQSPPPLHFNFQYMSFLKKKNTEFIKKEGWQGKTTPNICSSLSAWWCPSWNQRPVSSHNLAEQVWRSASRVKELSSDITWNGPWKHITMSHLMGPQWLCSCLRGHGDLDWIIGQEDEWLRHRHADLSSTLGPLRHQLDLVKGFKNQICNSVE